MKRLFMISSGLLLFTVTKAQNLEEAKKQMYYQRYISATKTLNHILQNDASNANAWYLLTDAYLQQDNVNKISDSLALVG